MTIDKQLILQLTLLLAVFWLSLLFLLHRLFQRVQNLSLWQSQSHHKEMSDLLNKLLSKTWEQYVQVASVQAQLQKDSEPVNQEFNPMWMDDQTEMQKLGQEINGTDTEVFAEIYPAE